MAVELQLVLRFEDGSQVPTEAELEDDMDCIVVEYDREDDI